MLIPVVAVSWWFTHHDGNLPAPSSPTDNDNNTALLHTLSQERSGVLVCGQGNVKKVLKDDTEGSRHQRFILDVDEGKTLLVAHNIDLAPRLPNLQTADNVSFCGQYENNARGGVIHWTHRDPAGRHANGWLEYKGQRYQ